VLVEVARVEEVVSSGKVGLSGRVVLVLPDVEAGTVKEGSRSCHHDVRHEGGCRFMKQAKRCINLALGSDSVHGRCGWQSRHGSSC
jgi:hypothetical protein